MKHAKTYKFGLTCALVVAYIALRISGIADTCLWFDEIFSVHAAEHSWNEILSFVALDVIHPPLFYVLLKLWIGIGGEYLFWLRTLPVFFSVIAIFPFISFCRELKLPFWTRTLALFFFVTNGSLIKYSQEVRMYSLLMCLSLLSMWLFARYFIKGKSFTLLLIVNILLVYTHYFGWFAVLAEVAAILISQRIKWRTIAAMFAITFASFIPWMIAIAQAAQTGSGLSQNIGWMSRPGILALIQFKLNLIEPFYYAASNIDPISIYRVSVPLLLIVAVSIILYGTNWNNHTEDEKRSTYLLLIFVLLPVFTAFVASWLLPYSIWGTRHLIIVFAPLSILLAAVLTKISNSKLRTAALTMILLFSGYGFALQATRETPQYIWCAWNGVAAAFVNGHNNAVPENLYAFESVTAYHLWFALRNTDEKVILVEGTGIPEDKAYFLPRGFDGVEVIDMQQIEDEHVSLAFRANEADVTKPPIANITSQGYEIESVTPFSAGESKAFLVRARKKN